MPSEYKIHLTFNKSLFLNINLGTKVWDSDKWAVINNGRFVINNGLPFFIACF